VDEAFANPPQSTEQILHPERYWDDDVPVEVTLSDLEAGLGDGWTESGQNVLGELGLRLTLAEHVGPAAAMRATEGWGGDLYLVLQNEDADTHAVVIQTIWDDQDEADEFWELYQTMMAHRPEYVQIVDTLVGELDHRRWAGETDYVYVTQKDLYVTIVIGPDQDSAEQIVEQLP
jgi:hypothetical protein